MFLIVFFLVCKKSCCFISSSTKVGICKLENLHTNHTHSSYLMIKMQMKNSLLIDQLLAAAHDEFILENFGRYIRFEYCKGFYRRKNDCKSIETITTCRFFLALELPFVKGKRRRIKQHPRTSCQIQRKQIFFF